MHEIEEEVLRRICPTDYENRKIMGIAQKVESELVKEAENMHLNVKFVLVGSVAKGTHLKNADIDIFIQYPRETPRESLEKSAIELGVRVIDGEIRYAEHPYVRGYVEGHEIDIVPCYEIRDASERMTAVDRTPLHTEFVKSRMKDEEKNEVRLLKRFMKGIGAYGAELAVQGFSGYLVELLILLYGSFRDVLRASLKWKKGERLKLPESSDAGLEYGTPLVFIDPTDPKRNVASALSMDKLSLFRYAAKCYLREPDIKFFFPPEEKYASMDEIRAAVRERGTYLAGVRIRKPDVIDDIYYPQIRKCISALKGYLQRNRFRVIREEFIVDEHITIVFELEHGKLPSAVKKMGPPVCNPAEENFMEKWAEKKAFSEPFIEGGRWYIVALRHNSTVESALGDAMRTLNIGKHLMEEAKKGFDVLSHEHLLNENYEKILTHLLFPRLPWKM